MIWIAIAVDTALYALLGVLIVWLGRRVLPHPWNQWAVTVPLVVIIGMLITLVSLPHWLVYPR